VGDDGRADLARRTSARRISSPSTTGTPSSENALPGWRRGKVGELFAGEPLVTAATAGPARADLIGSARIQRVTSTESFTGLVFAIAATAVNHLPTPPHPLAIVSLCSPPLAQVHVMSISPRHP